MILPGKSLPKRLSKWGFLFIFCLLLFPGCSPPQPSSSFQPPAPSPSDLPVSQPSSQEQVKLGVFLPLTGTLSSYGESVLHGIQLAVDEIAGGGGLLGSPPSLVVLDTQGDQEKAINVVKLLISREKVDALIGELTSTNSLAVAPLCQNEGVPMMTPTGTSPAITLVGDCIFRACATDPYQGYAMAVFARGTLRARESAILVDESSRYSASLALYFKETFQKLGGKVTVEGTYFQEDTLFDQQIAVMKKANPDFVYIPGYYPEVAELVKQIRARGLQATLAGGDGWEAPGPLGESAGALDGSYFTAHFFRGQESGKSQAFVEGFLKKFGRAPDSMSALGYDSVQLLAEGFKKARSKDKKKLKEALASIRDLQGTAGLITMDKERNPRRPITVVQVKNGEIQKVATIPPPSGRSVPPSAAPPLASPPLAAPPAAAPPVAAPPAAGSPRSPRSPRSSTPQPSPGNFPHQTQKIR